MDVFFKAVAGILIAVVLGLALNKQGKDMSVLLTIAVCCMVMAGAISYLSSVVGFFHRLQSIGNLDPGMLEILLKAVGIGLLAEIACLVCTDAGNAALGKSLQILAAAVVLWMSVPLFSGLLELVEQILGEV